MSEPSMVFVNGQETSIEGWRGRRLLDFLRKGLGLTGTKEGCGEGECGACTVLVDDEPMCSCLLLTDVVAGRAIRTVEGVDAPIREQLAAWIQDEGGVQCGFCTPGFVVMAQWLAEARPAAQALPKLLEGNLCRCTGYVQLERVMSALTETRDGRDELVDQ